MPDDALLAPIFDSKRLAALTSTGLLDSAPEPGYDALVELISELLATPVALVSLVSDSRQFFKAAVGLAEPWASRRETPLSHSFCKHVVATGAPLVVSDARKSAPLRENLALRELGVVAYAGVPLHVNGEAVGAFCAIDPAPRKWTDDNVRLLEKLARAVEGQIALRMANEALAEREAMLETVLTTMPAGVIVRDVEGRVLRANPAAGKILGRTMEAVRGMDLWAVTHPQDLAGDIQSREELLSGKQKVATRTKRYLHTLGHYVWVRLSAAVLRDAKSRIHGTIAVLEDVSDERAQVERIERARSLFESTIANVHDGVVVLDSQKRVLYANRAYASLLDFEQDDLLGMTADHFVEQMSTRVEDPAGFRELILSPPAGPDSSTTELTLVRPRRRHVRRTVARLDLPEGTGHVVVWQDVTLERELLAERERQALTDALTGIPNRRAAELELVKAAARAERSSTPLSVALFDVDHFKQVNDEYGHAAGDEVLRRIAGTLDAAKRLTDTVARWGGEEFVAILPVPLDGAVTFCERVRRDVASLVCPGVGHVSISAGVALLGEKEPLESVLKRADELLYAAKIAGRDQVKREGS